ncbi:NUDIX hydrolase [Planotetraspora kaengkrachanensis]|uniref:NUDIX hydrolase n=1 Tax=Planotetraspora kaengkrachanensis TaxID=575193 RepID=UPI00194553B6|nr:NUDIX domain-containing protein [Planotetraspora kaengkrachanensis]
MEEWRFCPVCGRDLDHLGSRENPYVKCRECEFFRYNNPLPTTIGVIEDEGKYLLVRRAIAPELGKWDSVGGFLAPGERAEECLAREAREEIDCELENIRPIGSYASIYGSTGLRTVGFAFTCSLARGSRIKLSSENSEYHWFRPEEIPVLAFEDVRRAVADVVGGRQHG